MGKSFFPLIVVFLNTIVKRPSSSLHSRYPKLLQAYLLSQESSPPTRLDVVSATPLFPSYAMAARIALHESIVHTLLKTITNRAAKTQLLKRAASFFAQAMISIDATKSGSKHTTLTKSIEALSMQSMLSAKAQQKLTQALAEKNVAFVHLQKSQAHHEHLLKKSENQQSQLRRLSRQLLSAQEDERLKISRELHDVIGQALASINIKLATLKLQSSANAKNLIRNINSTQRLVQKSVLIIHQFACELRPAVIDDLGLVSALDSMLSRFTERTRILTTLKNNTSLKELNTAQRTCLFRIAEEAFTNIARHSGANNAQVELLTTKTHVTMTIQDDGKGFRESAAWKSRVHKRLGLVGMRERAEMMHGVFTIESHLGQGTKITVEIPSATNRPNSNKKPKIL
jgi:signal transduction histidine kinase